MESRKGGRITIAPTVSHEKFQPNKLKMGKVIQLHWKEWKLCNFGIAWMLGRSYPFSPLSLTVVYVYLVAWSSIKKIRPKSPKFSISCSSRLYIFLRGCVILRRAVSFFPVFWDPGILTGWDPDPVLTPGSRIYDISYSIYNTLILNFHILC